MAELKNIVSASGKYNNIKTSITSNPTIVNIVESMVLIKEANKLNWNNGELKYTITIDNNTNIKYFNSKLENNIDTSLIDLVEGSIMINDVPSTYTYDNNTLTINLDIPSNDKTLVTFNATKKKNKFFILKSCCKLYYSDMEIISNYVTVISPINKRIDNFTCETPYWNN